ncbi:MAG: MotA/TolQ/ExbB proton channel family protein [Pirellulaceae bacterium]|nr:MotA/TolQ/ExbB proton channel family protein [Pirellulaceae bacterium]
MHDLTCPNTSPVQCNADMISTDRRKMRWTWIVSLLALWLISGPLCYQGISQEEVAQPAAAADADASPPASSESMLLTTWKALTPLYSIAFLMMSFLLIAVLVMMILAVRKDSFVPNDLLQGVEASLNDNNLAAAVELVRSDESFIGQVVSSGLGKLQIGKAQAMEAMQATGEDETMKLEHKLGYLALIGNIAPMVGLLGTVHGMVKSFAVIASSEQTPKPAKLALGIQTALYTTLVGLVIAIPAIICYNLLRNRVQRMVVEAGNESESMIEKFEVALRQGPAS